MLICGASGTYLYAVFRKFIIYMYYKPISENSLFFGCKYAFFKRCCLLNFKKIFTVLIDSNIRFYFSRVFHSFSHGLLARYIIFRVAHAPGMPGTFSPPSRVSDPYMHHGTCVTHVSWCMSGSLTSGFLWSRWRGKRSRHPRRISNPQFTCLVRGPWWSHIAACNLVNIASCNGLLSQGHKPLPVYISLMRPHDIHLGPDSI